MAELRRLMETKLSKLDAYNKCLKRAQKLGFVISISVPAQSLRIEKKNYTPIWWIAVIVGFLVYIVPGVLVLIYWKPIDYCELSFEDSEEEDYNTTVIANMKGEVGQEFYSQIGELLST